MAGRGIALDEFERIDVLVFFVEGLRRIVQELATVGQFECMRFAVPDFDDRPAFEFKLFNFAERRAVDIDELPEDPAASTYKDEGLVLLFVEVVAEHIVYARSSNHDQVHREVASVAVELLDDSMLV